MVRACWQVNGYWRGQRSLRENLFPDRPHFCLRWGGKHSWFSAGTFYTEATQLWTACPKPRLAYCMYLSPLCSCSEPCRPGHPDHASLLARTHLQCGQCQLSFSDCSRCIPGACQQCCSLDFLRKSASRASGNWNTPSKCWHKRHRLDWRGSSDIGCWSSNSEQPCTPCASH